MSIPVPFGQYVPADSPVHRLDARVKIALTAGYTVMLFLVDGFAGLAIAAAMASAAIAASRVPVRIVIRGLKAVSFLLVFTLLIHALKWRPATVSLLRLGPLAIDGPGLVQGLFFGLRVLLLVLGTSLVTLTTSPVALTDALERLMKPLEKLRFPAGDVAMMLTIALRFIPTTAEEAEKIVVAQSARGARFDARGPITRARAYVPVLVPLFVSLFRRADDLALAMESRCYRGGLGRTKYKQTHLVGTDWVVLLAGVASLAAVSLLL
jgi:energy-coupling factor transport system permease protein